MQFNILNSNGSCLIFDASYVLSYWKALQKLFHIFNYNAKDPVLISFNATSGELKARTHNEFLIVNFRYNKIQTLLMTV